MKRPVFIIASDDKTADQLKAAALQALERFDQAGEPSEDTQ